MSRNGSGTYNLPAGNPVVTGTTITTTWANTTLSDISSALTGSVAADGQTPMSGSLNMANNKVVSVLDPTSAQDAATKTYVDTADTTNLALTLLKANNLSDVASATTSRTNLSAAKSGANSDITSITGLTTPLTVGQGGTGSASTTYCNLTTNVTGTLPVANGGTGVTTSTGSGANVLGTSPSISGAVLSSMASSVITSGTAVASTSGTSITFSSIPSWVKRVTVLFNGVSTSGTSNLLIQLNSETTSYTGQADSLDSSVASTAGFLLTSSQLAAANTCDGAVEIRSFGSNTYISTGIIRQSSNRLAYSVGGKTTTAVMSSIQITTANGTDTFDAGSINILYE